MKKYIIFIFKKLEFFLVGLVAGLVFFFTPILMTGNFGIPWTERFGTFFKFIANDFLLSVFFMGIVYLITGVLPFSIYYFLFRKDSKRFFLSFSLFSSGLLVSYLIILLTIALAFSSSGPDIL